MEKHPFEILSFSAAWHQIKKRTRQLLLTLLFALFLGSLFPLLSRVEFIATATFSDKQQKNTTIDNSLLSLVGWEGKRSEGDGVMMMLSRTLMERVIKNLQLQGDIMEKKSALRHLLTRIKQNLRTEWSYLTLSFEPLLPDHPEPLALKTITYTGTKRRKFTLLFPTDETFFVYEKDEKIAEGTLGKPFSFPEGEAIVEKVTPISLKNKSFFFHAFPLSLQAEQWKKRLRIRTNEKKKEMLTLSFPHRNRFTAAQIVNGIMLAYQQFLEERHTQEVAEQIDYLQRRKKESQLSLEKQLHTFALHQREGAAQLGIVDTDKELEFLTKEMERYKDRLFNNELELHLLEKMSVAQNNADFFSSLPLSTLATKIRESEYRYDEIRSTLDRLIKEIPQHEEAIVSFAGIETESGEQLFLAFCKEKNLFEAKEKNFLQLREALENPYIDLPSINQIVDDSLVAQTITETRTLLLQSQDENNRTPREQERLGQEIALHHTFLTQYIDQNLLLTRQKISHITQQMVSLLLSLLEIYNHQITLDKKHLSNILTTYRDHLVEENGALQAHLRTLQTSLSRLPEKWVEEHLLQTDLTTQKLLMEETAKIIEAKNIQSHLEIIRSTPIDRALIPVHARYPGLLLWITLAGILSLLIFCTLALRSLTEAGAPAHTPTPQAPTPLGRTTDPVFTHSSAFPFAK